MSAYERAAVACALIRGIPTPGLKDPASALTTIYSNDLANELLASAAAGEPKEEWDRLWDDTDLLAHAARSERAQASRAAQRSCAEAGLTDDAQWADVTRLACRMASELAVKRPRLDSYVLPDGEPSDPREPYAQYPRAIGLALNMLPGLRTGFDEPGPAFIRRWGTEATYADELKSVLGYC